ncbi:MAG: O-antigen ligase family protein [Burkholderiales bacterium]
MRDRMDLAPSPSRASALRLRVFAFLEFSLAAWACIYLALVAVSGATYGRSFAFGFALAFAIWLCLGAIFYEAERVPLPDAYLLLAILAWAGWSAASYFWSVRPSLSRAEIGTEVGWGLCTAFAFYVAVRGAVSFRAVVTTAVAVAAALSAVAIYLVLLSPGADPEKSLSGLHGGVGAFSTYLVLVVPLLPMLLAERPMGYGTGPVALAGVAMLFVLLLLGARATENRMVWVAFAAGFVVAASLAAWRWRERLARAPWRWAAALVVLLIVVGGLFVDAATQRAKVDLRPDASVAKALADDPRFALWQYTFERIGERPWLGYGFGKSILRTEMEDELKDPLLVHAHNLFASQWVQTGAIGVALLCAMLLALAWRYAAFLRADDGTLAAIGLAGLAMLAMFVVKNLTDDFMIRPTSKEFWALAALLVGYGIRRERNWEK